MKTKEEIKKWLDFQYSELNDLEKGKILTENYIASMKYYKGAINALKWVLEIN